MPTCIKCQTTKSESEFTQSNGKSYVNMGLRKKFHPYCKSCNAQLAKERRKIGITNPGKITNTPEEHRPLMSMIRSKIHQAKDRARKKPSTSFDLDDEYLFDLWMRQSGKCKYTGATLVVTKSNPLTGSIDKIDPSLGYTKGNVQWVSWAVNRAKGDLSELDFLGMCEAVMTIWAPQS